MTRLIRSLVLAALSGLCALVMALGPFSFDAAADDGKAALKLAPKEIKGVIAINVERLRASPRYEFAMHMASSAVGEMLDDERNFREGLKELKEQAGVDLAKDLNSVVILIPADVSSDQALVVASGTFDQAKMTAFAKRKGAIEEKVGGQIMLKEASGKGALAFVGGHVLFGATPLVKSALTGGALDAEISKLTSAADASKDLWVAMEIPPELKAVAPEFGNLKSATASLDLSVGLVLKLTAESSSPDAAQKIAEVTKTWIAEAAPQPPFSNMGFSSALIRTKVSASGATIHLDFNLTDAEISPHFSGSPPNEWP